MRFFVLLLAFGVAASPQTPKRKKLLAIGAVQGFQHDSVSHSLATIERIGVESGLWDTYIRTDTQLITKKKFPKENVRNLDYFDAILFNATGELNMDSEQKAALLSFIREDGKGFLASHTGTDVFFQWPEYGELVGGYFDQHPWHQEVKINVEDRAFPAMRNLPPSFTINDEIYQLRNYSRDKVHVLMSLDTGSVDLNAKLVHRTDKDFPVAWVRDYGKGRMFSCSLGHESAVWDRKDFQKMWLEAIQWAMGMKQ